MAVVSSLSLPALKSPLAASYSPLLARGQLSGRPVGQFKEPRLSKSFWPTGWERCPGVRCGSRGSPVRREASKAGRRASAAGTPEERDGGSAELDLGGGGAARETHSAEEDVSLTRRATMVAGVALMSGIIMTSSPNKAWARERRPAKVSVEEFSTSDSGIRYYDYVVGKGQEAVPQLKAVATVHFDCQYKSLTVVSTRESKLLAENRIISEPYNFTLGAKPGSERQRNDVVDSANGMFSAQAAPRPPKALYSAVYGMRVGGKRSVLVTPDQGYGVKGFGEIPPGADFILNIELLGLNDAQ